MNRRPSSQQLKHHRNSRFDRAQSVGVCKHRAWDRDHPALGAARRSNYFDPFTLSLLQGCLKRVVKRSVAGCSDNQPLHPCGCQRLHDCTARAGVAHDNFHVRTLCGLRQSRYIFYS